MPVLLAPLVLLALGSAGAQSPSSAPTASAGAWAVEVTLPSGVAASTPAATAPPAAAPVAGGAFAYPADGSVVSVQSSLASATTKVEANASAGAESEASGISLFGGEITADAVTARASAGTGYSGAGGNQNGSTVTNLLVNGQPVSGAQHVALGDWGQLGVDVTAIDRSAPPGTRGYDGSVVELDVTLTAAHGGLPSGSEIRIGYADAAVQTAPPPAETTTTTTTTTAPTTTAAEPSQEPPLGDRPVRRPLRPQKKGGPLRLHPKLTAGRYVFPVYGPVSYGDTFGAPRSDVTYHHGDDIFGQLGQPLVACADGTIFSVGWNKIGGNRLWLLDEQGNQFYYAHLSAFSTLAVDGAHVKAGQVIGFMGNTGDAEGTPVHLHFEIHPVSLLYLGYDGAVDPTPYLNAWQHQQDLPFPVAASWLAVVPGGSAPEPGAILLGMNDISSADGLDPESLRRALVPPNPASLLRELAAPTTAPAAPTRDLGRG
ncbi:MAG TPA: M23 family metallopeptidase [Gaiellaceae bacterium]|nr:M23 family metallopeptidase [Gaiellaceae bacterium]